MSVTKDTVERYSIRTDHEHASIFIRCWDRMANVGTPHEGIYYCGEIAINSSYGSWGYTWTACGSPFKKFLIGAEFGYVFTKFMGSDLHRFDGPASVREMFTVIARDRREGSMSKSEAREAWDLLDEARDEAECGSRDFGDAMRYVAGNLPLEHPMRDNFNDCMAWPHCTKYEIQAEGFWKTIWPEFVGALRAETDQHKES